MPRGARGGAMSALGVAEYAGNGSHGFVCRFEVSFGPSVCKLGARRGP